MTDVVGATKLQVTMRPSFSLYGRCGIHRDRLRSPREREVNKA